MCPMPHNTVLTAGTSYHILFCCVRSFDLQVSREGAGEGANETV